MVLGANKVFGSYTTPTFTVGGKEQFTRPIQTEYKQPVQGVNYAQYDGGAKANYAKFDTYQSPVTTGRAGDKFDMMM